MTAYAIFTLESVTDQAELDLYQAQVVAAGKGHPLTPLAVYGDLQVLEGDDFKGAVIVSFPSVAEARAWYDDPVYQAVAVHRKAGAKYRVFIIEGVE